MIRRDPNYRPPPPWPPEPALAATQTAATATATAATAAAGQPSRPRRHRRPAPRRRGRGRSAGPTAEGRKSLDANGIGAGSCWRCCSCSSSAVVAGGLWMDTSLHRIPALADYPERPAAGAGTTWLLVGSDSRQQPDPRTAGGTGHRRRHRQRPHRHDPAGAPTRRSGRARPRRWCPFRGTPMSRSPATAATRSTRRSSRAEHRCWRRPSSRPPGLRLDHYAEIGFDGFAVMVDAVGGVTMCPDRTDQRSAGGHRPARRLPRTRRAHRARLRPHARHPARRSGPDGQPARSSCPRCCTAPPARRVAQPAALVSDGACGGRAP